MLNFSSILLAVSVIKSRSPTNFFKHLLILYSYGLPTDRISYYSFFWTLPCLKINVKLSPLSVAPYYNKLTLKWALFI